MKASRLLNCSFINTALSKHTTSTSFLNTVPTQYSRCIDCGETQLINVNLRISCQNEITF